MASSLAIKRLASKILIRPLPAARTLLITPTAAATTTRSSSLLFSNTCSNLALGSRNYSSSNSLRTTFPFAVTKGMGQLMKPAVEKYEKFTGTHFVLYSTPTCDCGTTGEITEDDEALYLKVNMPGLSREDVKVGVFDNKELVIMGQQGIEKQMKEDPSEVEEVHVTRYIGSLALTPNSYKKEGIKWEMKHGQLRVTVPRI